MKGERSMKKSNAEVCCVHVCVLAASLILVCCSAVGAGVLSAPNLALTATASATSEFPGLPASYVNDGDMSTRWGRETVDTEVTLEWSTAQTLNTVIMRQYEGCCQISSMYLWYWDDFFSDWVGLPTAIAAVSSPNTIVCSFPAVTTMKLKLGYPVTVWELEVYDSSLISGTITNQTTGAPMVGISVSAGALVVSTADFGDYRIPAGPGLIGVVAEKGVARAEQSVQVEAGQNYTGIDMQLPSHNLGPLGTATASSNIEGPVSYLNDDNLATRWVYNYTLDPPDDDLWVAIDWGLSPQTFNQIVVRPWEGCCTVTSLKVEVWDDATSDYKVVTTVGDGVNSLGLVIAVNFPTQTSSKLRVSKVMTIYELEVYNGVAVTGYVKEVGTGRGIAGATILGGSSPVTSAGDASYTLSCPSGDIWLRAFRRGYDDAELPVTVPPGGLTQDIEMQPDGGQRDNLAFYALATASGEESGRPPSLAIDGDMGTRWSQNPPGDYTGGWFQLEWPYDETLNAVVVHQAYQLMSQFRAYYWDGADWQLAGDYGGSIPMSPELYFSAVTTRKLKLMTPITDWEIEVFNRAAPPTEPVSGYVLDSVTSRPISEAQVTDGGSHIAISEADGSYTLDTFGGAVTLYASAANYKTLELPVTVPSGGLTLDLIMEYVAVPPPTWPNIAPLATATASSEESGRPPSLAIDENMSTRWSQAPPGDYTDGWFQLEWPSPVVVSAVTAYQYAGLMSQFKAYYWDDSAWQLAAEYSGAIPGNPTLLFPTSVTTTRLKLMSPITDWEIEVRSPVSSSISDAKRSADGTMAVITGVVTAILPDGAYLESVDRAAGIRVVPAGAISEVNKLATVGGYVTTTLDGERIFVASSVQMGDTATVAPLGMRNQWLSAQDVTPVGSPNDVKLSTIGLLVETWGRVVRTVPASGGAKYLYVDDGSGVQSDLPGVNGVKVGPVVADIIEGDFVTAVGISRTINADGVAVRALCPRSSSDVTKP